ncbi:MAG: methylated-DNA--[protein]-cysteine S-methyltransferase, partial [Paracoccaceae bacterium]
MASQTMDSPLGLLSVLATDVGVARLGWGAHAIAEPPKGLGGPSPLTARAVDQLTAYFAGSLRAFDLPLDIAGSDAQRRVCAQMSAIPFGDTTTYGAIARTTALSAQAVGQLCGGNPIPVIVPCHRVLGATSLGGFS